MKPHSQHIVDSLEVQLKAGNIPSCVEGLVTAVIDQCRTHQRQDRSALLRMAGNIASGLMSANGGWMSADTTLENVAKSCVMLARAILEEVDRGE